MLITLPWAGVCTLVSAPNPRPGEEVQQEDVE